MASRVASRPYREEGKKARNRQEKEKQREEEKRLLKICARHSSRDFCCDLSLYSSPR